MKHESSLLRVLASLASLFYFHQPLSAQGIKAQLAYSTYLGGFMEEIAWAVAVDDVGGIYIGGLTYSADFPTVDAWDAIFSGTNDGFVSKLDSSGTSLIFSTFLGGSHHALNHEQVTGLAVDSKGNLVMVGQLASANFPTFNAIQPNFGGGFDAFVAKLNPNVPEFLFASYLGGSGIDNAVGLALDSDDNILLTGFTTSRDFPMVNALQPTHGGGTFLGGFDAYVAKLSSDGSQLLFSTYLGGSGHDAGFGVAVDSQSRVYVTGSTGSTDFPTKNAFQPSHAGGFNLSGVLSDAFVAKLSATGSELLYSTFLGGRAGEHMDLFSFTARIAVDAEGNAYITGDTNSADFPTENAMQPHHGGGDLDAFITKLNPSGSALVYSTFLGGVASDRGRGITVDPLTGSAYVSGLTASPDFPTVNAMQPAFGGGDFDAFIARLSPSGTQLLFSSFLGGNDFDNALGVALDSRGQVYLTGLTASTDFPITADALQKTNSGIADAFLAKLVLDIATAVASEEAPKTFALHQNYPNPFNDATTIPFSLAADARVTLTIYNAVGKELGFPLLDVRYAAGHHRVSWDAKDRSGRSLPSGIYFYQIRAGRFTQVRKMLLVR